MKKRVLKGFLLIVASVMVASCSTTKSNETVKDTDQMATQTNETIAKAEETDTEETQTPQEGMKLVWSDEFDTETVPSSQNWNYYPGPVYNNEVESYTDSPDTAFIQNGILTIKAVKDSQGAWRSARLNTMDKATFTYGYVEARIKVPADNGTWPAFWMMSNDNPYGTWPCSGELDVMEHSPSTTGLNTVFSTVHVGSSVGTHQWTSLNNEKLATASLQFHTYGMKWTDTYIQSYVDGKPVGIKYMKGDKDWTQWPFDNKYYIILNLAMGGDLGGTIDEGLTQSTYQIDYVRVWQ